MNKQVLLLIRSLYATNFVTYYKTHAFHFNVEGKNFSQDHEFLNELYDFLWKESDNIGEQIRQLNKATPTTLKSLIEMSSTEEDTLITTPEDMYMCLSKDLQSLIDIGNDLYKAAGSCNCYALETYIGDYLTGVSKYKWMIDATLKRSIK
jgi:starvation-inducible DNA-binding protein